MEKQWISVDESVPPIVGKYLSQAVLVYSFDNSFSIGFYNYYNKHWEKYGSNVATVTHWQYLPTPPITPPATTP